MAKICRCVLKVSERDWIAITLDNCLIGFRLISIVCEVGKNDTNFIKKILILQYLSSIFFWNYTRKPFQFNNFDRILWLHTFDILNNIFLIDIVFNIVYKQNLFTKNSLVNKR